MKFSKEIWAVIPARSGSKTIKNKNIKKFSGKPLIAYSIIIANKIKKIRRTIFSSDSSKYFEIAKKFGKIEFHKRSKKNSSETATDFDLFKEIVFSFKEKNILLPEFFVHLRPTTPIRGKKHVENAIKLLIKNKKKYDSLRSINIMSQSSYKNFRILNKKLSGIKKKDFDIDKFNLPRNNYEDTYEANGIVDIYKTKNILKGFLAGKKSYPYIINYINSDINNLKDFYTYENLFKQKLKF